KPTSDLHVARDLRRRAPRVVRAVGVADRDRGELLGREVEHGEVDRVELAAHLWQVAAFRERAHTARPAEVEVQEPLVAVLVVDELIGARDDLERARLDQREPEPVLAAERAVAARGAREIEVGAKADRAAVTASGVSHICTSTPAAKTNRSPGEISRAPRD